MNYESEILPLLEDAGVVKTGHFVYTSGKHGSVYVDKDEIYKLSRHVVPVCECFADFFKSAGIDVVVSPATGGIALIQHTAAALGALCKRDVAAVYTVKKTDKVILNLEMPIGATVETELKNVLGKSISSKLIGVEIRERMAFKTASYADEVKGKRVLVLEDITTTGGSARDTIQVVFDAGGIIAGIGVVWNRGGIDLKDLLPDGASKAIATVSLVEKQFPAVPEEECPLCREGVPVNTEVGHGAEFLRKTGKEDKH